MPPSPHIDDLTTPVTRKEFEASMYAGLAAVGLKTSSWIPGAVVRAIITAFCVVLYALSVLISLVARSGFLELSSGAWLRICAYFGFDVEAKTKTFASGLLRIDNSSAYVYNEDTGDMVFVGGNGQEYVNLEPVSIAANQTGVFVNVRATTAGIIGQAPAGTITRFSTAYNGLTVTNPTALNARDDESDDLLRKRARISAASQSPNGPHDVYEAVAYSATRANGTDLNINRVRPVRGPGDGSMTLYVANASGAVPGDRENPSTDLGALQVAIDTKATPLGMTTRVASGIPVVINVAYEVWIYTTAAITSEDARNKINDAVNGYIKTRNIGGDRISYTVGAVYLERIRATILAAIPKDSAFRCVLTSPTSDVPCERFNVPVPGVIDGIVHLVNPNE